MNKVLFDTKFLQLKSTVAKSGHNWVYAHRPNANDVVVILPIIEGDKVLFLKEERPPIQAENRGKYVLGLPAGLVGDERKGETLEDAMKAELLEETGLIVDKIEIKTKKVASSAGCVSETFAIAFAYINEYKEVQKPVTDGGIIVDRILVNKNDIFRWLKIQEENGIILTSQLLATLFYLGEKDDN